MLFWTLIFLFCHLDGAVTAPVQQDNEYIHWEPEPNGRGTWSVLSSCVVTLVLCVYTAVHMHVPHASATTFDKRLRLAQWILMGIVAPEVVLFASWGQWQTAKALSKELEVLGDTATKDDQAVPLMVSYGSRYKSKEHLLASWTIQHSFLVVMGGYQFNPKSVHASPGSLPRTVIQPHTFLDLVESGHADKIPILSVKDIADRSKADNIAKTLSCIQGFWLVLQLLGRAVNQLTITELEVNTLAHVVCALGMYTFWMSKPFNVQQPVFVDSVGLESWLLLHSRPRHFDDLFDEGKMCRKYAVPDHTRVVHEHEKYIPDQKCDICSSNLDVEKRRPLVALILNSSVVMTPSELISNLQQLNSSKCYIDYVMKETKECEPVPDQVEDEGADGHKRIAIFVGHNRLEAFLDIWALPDRDQLLSKFLKKNRLKTKALTLSSVAIYDKTPEPMPFSILVVTLCSAGYGGLHATLWYHHFPTLVELWLWRVSSIVVASEAAFMFLLLLAEFTMYYDTHPTILSMFCGLDVFNLFRKPVKFVTGLDPDEILPIMTFMADDHKILSALASTVAFVALFFCRSFLFIEAFISLRSQPPTAYLTPSWSQWIPHL